MVERMTVEQAAEWFQAQVAALKVELPGISFGYIGNCGVNRYGKFDDRSWSVFTKLGNTPMDRVSVAYTTEELPFAVAKWPSIEARLRAMHAKEGGR